MSLLKTENDARAFVAARCAPSDYTRLERFVEFLRLANDRQNLVSRSSLDIVWLRHIADSAQLLDHVPRETAPWLDLGTGSGFPGLALAIMQPSRKFVLIESRNLRIQWLNEMIQQLSISNALVEGRDVMTVSSINAAVLSARAFAPLNRLISQAARFSTIDSGWVLPKGRSAAQEVKMLPSSIRQMFHVKQSVTDEHAGIVVGVGKVSISE